MLNPIMNVYFKEFSANYKYACMSCLIFNSLSVRTLAAQRVLQPFIILQAEKVLTRFSPTILCVLYHNSLRKRNPYPFPHIATDYQTLNFGEFPQKSQLQYIQIVFQRVHFRLASLAVSAVSLMLSQLFYDALLRLSRRFRFLFRVRCFSPPHFNIVSHQKLKTK